MAEIFNVDESFDRNRFDGACCAFGVFDGVHEGHQALLSCAREDAAKRGSASFVLTFDTDPDEMFRPNELKKLMTNEDRIQALAASGVDFVTVLPFTREFASLPPEEFLAWTFGEHAACEHSCRLRIPLRGSCEGHRGDACCVGFSQYVRCHRA